MGADMISLVIPVKGTPDTITLPSPDQAEDIHAAWKAEWDKLTETEQADWAVQSYMDEYEDPVAAVKDMLDAALGNLHSSRQWDWKVAPGHILLVTGGYSFGDGPTDAWDEWCRVLDADIHDAIWNACGFGWDTKALKEQP